MILVDFINRGTTLNSKVHYEASKNARRSIQNKSRGMQTSGHIFLLEKASPHTLLRYQVVNVCHLQYSPGLVACEDEEIACIP